MNDALAHGLLGLTAVLMAAWSVAVAVLQTRIDNPRVVSGLVAASGALVFLTVLQALAASPALADDLVRIPLLVACVLAAALGGGPVVLAVFDVIGRGQTGGSPTEEPLPSADALRGGAWIGVLERAAVALCIVSGAIELIAVVLAVKGIGRYPSFKSSGTASESFIIGTFVSILWAVFASLGAVA